MIHQLTPAQMHRLGSHVALSTGGERLQLAYMRRMISNTFKHMLASNGYTRAKFTASEKEKINKLTAVFAGLRLAPRALGEY